jgi:Trk K+ transport system NAD-binding subunit
MLRAQLRDMRVLFRESRNSIVLFLVVLISGALLLHFFYTYPGTDQHPRFGVAVHATFALIFFETLFPFPDEWYVQILFFLIPIIGLAALADGVLHFGTALINKRERGQKWQVAMASTFQDHIIICGVGRVGYRVIIELLQFGREVVAIELEANTRFVEKIIEMGVPVIIADARRSENLVKAGVERADAIVPCTNDELANLDIALDARELNPDIKVVMRMFDADFARRVEKGFGIHTAFSTSALAAPSFAAAAMRVNVKHSFYVGDSLLILSEVCISSNSQLAGWTIEKLQDQLQLSVVCHQGAEAADLHPSPDLELNPGDQLLVLASLETLRRLNDLGCHPADQRTNIDQSLDKR